jgi:hypothetical protein
MRIFTLDKIQPKVILYINPKYENILSLLQKYSEQLLPLAARVVYDKHKDFIENSINLSEEYYLKHYKMLYFLCIIEAALEKKEGDIELLKNIKNARFSKEFSLEDRKKLITILQNF